MRTCIVYNVYVCLSPFESFTNLHISAGIITPLDIKVIYEHG